MSPLLKYRITATTTCFPCCRRKMVTEEPSDLPGTYDVIRYIINFDGSYWKVQLTGKEQGCRGTLDTARDVNYL